jgi:predicted ATP-dependent endonuclease of OLD family
VWLKAVANSELSAAQIRQIEIKNFRDIGLLTWDPSLGINCLVGPDDTGKSTVFGHH